MVEIRSVTVEPGVQPMSEIQLLSTPAWWSIELHGGASVRLFADSYASRDEVIVFYVQLGSQSPFDPSFDVDEMSVDGSRVSVRVAEFPKECVISILTA